MSPAGAPPAASPDASRRGVRSDLVAALAAALLTALVGGLFVVATGVEVWHNDGLDYAQIGREVAEGRGMASRQAIYALHLRFLAEHGLLDAPWPNLHRFPLPTLTLALFFLLFGASSATVAAHGVVGLAATSGVLHLWARRALGPWPAVAASALVAFNGELFYGLQAGMPEVWVALWATTALYLLWRGGWLDGRLGSDVGSGRGARVLQPSGLRPGSRPGLHAALAGAALGLAALSRTNSITLLPVVLLALVPWRELRGGGEDRRRALRRFGAAAALLLGGLLLVASPFLARNLKLTGAPTFSLHSYYLVPSGAHPGETKKDLSLTWVREFVPPLDYARQHRRAVAEKWLRQNAELAAAYPTFAQTLLLPLLPWLALLPPLRRRLGIALPRTAAVVCGGFVANAALCGFTDVNPERYYLFLLPAMVLVAVGMVQGAARALEPRLGPGWRAALATLAVAVMAHPAALAATLAKVEQKGRVRLDLEQLQAIERATAPDAVIFSDRSAQVAWYTGRRSVRFHHTRDASGRRVAAALEIDRDLVPLDAIYLSGPFLSQPRRRKLWTRLESDPAFPARFTCPTRFPDGAVLCVRREKEGSWSSNSNQSLHQN